MKDNLFSFEPSKQFEFDKSVANVFDDMIARSVPYYSDILKLCIDFALQAIHEDSLVYDLGCSTGNFLLELVFKLGDKKTQLIGIDNSQAMIERAKLKADTYGKNIDFLCADFLNIDILNASVIVAIYTLQFIRPIQREELVKKIFRGLNTGGILILSEKMTTQDKVLDKLMIDRYYLYKKEQGYTQSEHWRMS